jgi:hypothetical protein
MNNMISSLKNFTNLFNTNNKSPNLTQDVYKEVNKIQSQKRENTSFCKILDWKEIEVPIGKAGIISNGEKFFHGENTSLSEPSKNDIHPLRLLHKLKKRKRENQKDYGQWRHY